MMRRLFTTSTTITDDRGERFELWSPGPRWAEATGEAGADSSGPGPELTARIESVLSSREYNWLREPLTAGGVLLLLVMMVLAIMLVALLPRPWGVAAFPLLSVVALAVNRFRVRRRLAGSIRATLVGAGHCASCGYALHDLPVAEDGLTTCPECGAAWRLIGAPTPVAGIILVGETGARRAPVHGGLLDWFLGGSAARAFATLDDRGRMVDLVYPRVRAHPPRCWSSVPPDERRQIGRRLSELTMGGRALSFTLLTLVTIGLVTGTALRFATASAFSKVALAVFFAVVVPTALYTAIFRPHGFIKNRRQVVRLLLAEGRCASCAADLIGVAAERDGCRVCPECGAAWRGVVDSASRPRRGNREETT